MKTIKTILLGTLIASLVFPGVFLSAGKLEAKEKIYGLKVYTYQDRAALNWYTDSGYYAELQYGETENYGSKIYVDQKSDWHSYEITGLKPGTTYYYKIVIKDRKGKVVTEQKGELTTFGVQPNLQVYKQFMYVSFDFNKRFYSFNNQYPTEILNPAGLKVADPSIWQGALQVKDKNSHVTYACDPLFNAGYGTVMAWVRLEDFNKSMVIWQTDDSRYALYFEHGSNFNRLVARAGFDEIVGTSRDLSKDEEAYYFFKTTGTGVNTWLSGEWHLIGLTWNGKLNGTVKLYFDGEKKDEANYTHGAGCTNFMLGNNYKHTMNWSNGQIDDFKLFDWDMDSTAMRNEYRVYAVNKQKDLLAKRTGQVAGIKIRYFKEGKLLKAPDYKIYVVSQGKRLHIADLAALKRFKRHPIIAVNWDEINQYQDGGTFSVWSNYPDGTLLKAYGKSTVYWLWNGQVKPILNAAVFKKYGNDWADVITITAEELGTYPVGTVSR